MLDVKQFRSAVVAPILTTLAGWKAPINSPAAENLLVGTALQESALTYLRQRGGGPGMGVMQIEPATHDDVWTNFVDFRSNLGTVLKTLAAGSTPSSEQLPWNIGYSVAIARLIFWRVPTALPAADDIQGLGQFWKDHYNTASGAGTAAQWVANYQKYATPSP